MRRVVTALVLAAFTAPAPVAAWSCRRTHQNLAFQCATSDFVFVGEVVSIAEIGDTYRVRFRVLDVVRGDVPTYVEVPITGPDDPCPGGASGFDPQVGKVFRLFFRGPDQVYISMCSYFEEVIYRDEVDDETCSDPRVEAALWPRQGAQEAEFRPEPPAQGGCASCTVATHRRHAAAGVILFLGFCAVLVARRRRTSRAIRGPALRCLNGTGS